MFNGFWDRGLRFFSMGGGGDCNGLDLNFQWLTIWWIVCKSSYFATSCRHHRGFELTYRWDPWCCTFFHLMWWNFSHLHGNKQSRWSNLCVVSLTSVPQALQSPYKYNCELHILQISTLYIVSSDFLKWVIRESKQLSDILFCRQYLLIQWDKNLLRSLTFNWQL